MEDARDGDGRDLASRGDRRRPDRQVDDRRLRGGHGLLDERGDEDHLLRQRRLHGGPGRDPRADVPQLPARDRRLLPRDQRHLPEPPDLRACVAVLRRRPARPDAVADDRLLRRARRRLRRADPPGHLAVGRVGGRLPGDARRGHRRVRRAAALVQAHRGTLVGDVRAPRRGLHLGHGAHARGDRGVPGALQSPGGRHVDRRAAVRARGQLRDVADHDAVHRRGDHVGVLRPARAQGGLRPRGAGRADGRRARGRPGAPLWATFGRAGRVRQPGRAPPRVPRRRTSAARRSRPRRRRPGTWAPPARRPPPQRPPAPDE